jgi:hypothetical protein
LNPLGSIILHLNPESAVELASESSTYATNYVQHKNKIKYINAAEEGSDLI